MNSLLRFIIDVFLCAVFYFIYPYLWQLINRFFPTLQNNSLYLFLYQVLLFPFLTIPFIFSLKSSRNRSIFLKLVYLVVIIGFFYKTGMLIMNSRFSFGSIQIPDILNIFRFRPAWLLN